MKPLHCALLVGAAAALVGAAAHAQAPAPARVGKDRPITRQWTCETGRELLLNFNPRRVREEAWLTYGGNRAQVFRVRSASGVVYASKDGKVKLVEQGDQGTVEFADVIDKPVLCTLVKPKPKKK